MLKAKGDSLPTSLELELPSQYLYTTSPLVAVCIQSNYGDSIAVVSIRCFTWLVTASNRLSLKRGGWVLKLCVDDGEGP